MHAAASMKPSFVNVSNFSCGLDINVGTKGAEEDDGVDLMSSMPSDDLLVGVELLQSVGKKGNNSRGMCTVWMHCMCVKLILPTSVCSPSFC